MRLISILLALAGLLCGCASDGTTGGSQGRYVYGDWPYYQQAWYDDDFWVWVDEHPNCCDGQSDLREALQDWYGQLDPDQQQAVRDRVQSWMDEHGVVPAAGQSAKELVLETASERWSVLTPAERRQWVDQRRSRVEQRRVAGSAAGRDFERRALLGEGAAGLSPEQRAALLESAQGISFDRTGASGAQGGSRSISRHPSPARPGLSGGARFRAAGGGGRGGRGGRGR